MQITRDFTIAVHSLLCIDYFKDSYTVTSNFIASSVGVNSVIIRNILGKLKAHNLVEIHHGKKGMKLSKPLEKISLYDIYIAVEAEKRPLVNFHEHPNPDCPVGSKIHLVLDDRLDQSQKIFEDSLKNTNLSNLLEKLHSL